MDINKIIGTRPNPVDKILGIHRMQQKRFKQLYDDEKQVGDKIQIEYKNVMVYVVNKIRESNPHDKFAYIMIDPQTGSDSDKMVKMYNHHIIPEQDQKMLVEEIEKALAKMHK